jgi:predicted dehydrogenase
MPFSIVMIGSGQFSGSFAHLFHLHPGVSKVYAVDTLPQRASELVNRYSLAGTFASLKRLWPAPTSRRWRSSPSGGPTARWWSTP